MKKHSEVRVVPQMNNSMQTLSDLIEQEVDTPISPGSTAMSEALRERFGEAVLGILYYGSCFRSGTEKDGILDIFVIVDDYAKVYETRTLALANHLLPPNVFYHELTFEGTTLRTKYAVLSLDQFVHRTSSRCFHTFFWARFAQPCALTYYRSESAKARIVEALAGSIMTFVRQTLPLIPSPTSAANLWTLGLSASYRTELRPEAPGAAARLVEKNLERYADVTHLASQLLVDINLLDRHTDPAQYAITLSPWQRATGRLRWRVRRVQGKIINLLRIMKAAFTFDGGVDYVLWKIERHSGVKVEATPMLRRHPLLTCWPTVWRLYRAGAFR